MKRWIWIGVAAIAVWGVYRLNVGLENAGTVPHAAHNRAQAAAGWSIGPADARSNSELRVVNENDEKALSCRWFRNGNEISGQTESTLAPGQFSRGDDIEAEVTPAAGGKPVRTAAVQILNTAPRIQAASADIRTSPSAAIEVLVSAADPDNDKISYSYQWYRNGKLLGDETGASVSVARFEMGDEVAAAVTASDGEESSPPEKTDPIKIGSNAPDITSSPPTTLQPGRRFVYQVSVSAPRPDAVKYQLLDAPDGMTIDESGLIEWTMPALEATTHVYEVAVRVSDPTGGEAVQRFHLSGAVQKSSNE